MRCPRCRRYYSSGLNFGGHVGHYTPRCGVCGRVLEKGPEPKHRRRRRNKPDELELLPYQVSLPRMRGPAE